VPAWQARFQARGRITSPCAAVRHSLALFAPTNHEERWGDHSFVLDSAWGSRRAVRDQEEQRWTKCETVLAMPGSAKVKVGAFEAQLMSAGVAQGREARAAVSVLS